MSKRVTRSDNRRVAQAFIPRNVLMLGCRLTGILIALTPVSTYAADYLSPVAVVADGSTLYVAAGTAGKVLVVDAKAGKVQRTIHLDQTPNGVALSADKRTLFVTGDAAEGKVFVLEAATGRPKATIAAGHTPMSPVISGDGSRLYVCNRFNNNVAVIDLAQNKVIKTVDVTREPVAAVLAPDNHLLFVANHLPTGAANVDRMTAVIDVIDTVEIKVVASIALPNGAIDLRGIALSADKKHIYVPSILARFNVPPTQVERGWINTHALNIIDVERRELLWTILLDDVERGAANPWGVVASPDGKTLCVSHAGTHEVSLIDLPALMAKLEPLPARATSGLSVDKYEALPDNPINSLGFLSGIRRRVTLPGQGPRGLCMADGEFAVTEFFSDSVALVAPDSGSVRSIGLGWDGKIDIVRQGHMLFEDAALCFQHWQSCSTCHPDGRMDAVNWDLLNDGIGNPKSTKSLLFAHVTPPAMVSGVRGSAEIAVRAGIRHILFSEPNEEDAMALDAYIKSMTPVPSPYLIKGQLSGAARRGRQHFESANCAACHSGPYFTNLKSFDVGTTAGMDKGKALDTPTLREVWRTAPYLYDGRAATMHEVLTKFNKNDQHGRTSSLSAQEIQELIEYVLSL